MRASTHQRSTRDSSTTVFMSFGDMCGGNSTPPIHRHLTLFLRMREGVMVWIDTRQVARCSIIHFISRGWLEFSATESLSHLNRRQGVARNIFPIRRPRAQEDDGVKASSCLNPSSAQPPTSATITPDGLALPRRGKASAARTSGRPDRSEVVRAICSMIMADNC